MYVTARPETTAELVISESVDVKLMEKKPSKANPLYKGIEQWMRESKFWYVAHNAAVRLRRDLYPDARVQPKFPIVNAVLMKIWKWETGSWIRHLECHAHGHVLV